MPSIPAIDPELLASFVAPHPGWRWPDYARALAPGSAIPLLGSPSWRGLLGALLPASFVEWRYYAVISDAFRGIVGLALVNPRNHFPWLGESGVLAIVAGLLDRPADRLALTGAERVADLCELCWMHLFPFSHCTFDDPSPGSLTAEDRCVRLRFAAEQMRLEWAERCRDPALGAVRPLRRMVSAEADGLRLALDARVVHRIPLLRHERPAPRHFFICEEIGIACWSLSDERGRVIAKASDQPCGSKLAHPRLRVPGGRSAT